MKRILENEYVQNIKKLFTENKLFLFFIITLLINTSLLRFTTLHDYTAIKPIIGDLIVLLLISSIYFLIKSKRRNKFLFIMSVFITAICIINSMYFRYYSNFASVSALSSAIYIYDVKDSIAQQAINPLDFIYLWQPIVFYIYLKKKKRIVSVEEMNKRDKFNALLTLMCTGAVFMLFLTSLTSLEVSRFNKQWNREYVVMRFGILIYHVNDLYSNIVPKFYSIFGVEDALNEMDEYYTTYAKNAEDNEYTDIFKGKNIILIHAESLQTNVINKSINGKEITPNFSKLANEGIYFDNFYNQVSTGTSSDAEFIVSTGLHATANGIAFMNYFNNEYVSIENSLQDLGYYVSAFHGNKGDFWNRNVMYKALGYDKFYSQSSFEIDEVIGFGISDKSFFKQSIPILQDIKNENKNYMAKFITLSNHTPFDALDSYGEFDLTMNYEVTNPETGEVTTENATWIDDELIGNYIKSVSYSDEAIGEFINEMDTAGLLENTVVIIYGDHDAKLGKSEYEFMENYDPTTDEKISKDSENYVTYDYYAYQQTKKVPFIIWTKDKQFNTKISTVMGMSDVLPTLGNMFGFSSEYAMGTDIFNSLDDNIVIFPNGDFVTNKLMYYSKKEEYKVLSEEPLSDTYLNDYITYTSSTIETSKNIITYDLIRKNNEKKLITE